MSSDYRWSPITDLPEDTAALSDGELGPLIEVWKEQRSGIADTSGVDEFVKQLNREWAIETGLIEGAYSFSRGVTESLIAHGIEAARIPPSEGRGPEETASIIWDHLEALDWVFAFVKGQRELTTGFINELHGLLLRHVKTYRAMNSLGQFFDKDLQKGTYKTDPNNVVKADGTKYEFCPPMQVASEMERLVVLHREHVRRGERPEIQAAWLHHRFTQIHPFQDGNGRVARALATLVFLRAGSLPVLVRNDDKDSYLNSLEAADAGNLETFAALLVRFQRRALLGAIHAIPVSPSPDGGTAEPATVEQAVQSARTLLENRGQIGRKEWAQAKVLGEQLWSNVLGPSMDRMLATLQREIGAFYKDSKFRFLGEDPSSLRSVDWAGHIGHDVNTGEWQRQRILGARVQREARIIVVLFAVGKQYRGVIGGSVLFSDQNQPPLPTSDEFFQVNYKDSQEGAEKRFVGWLERQLTRAIGMWRETL